MDKRNHIDIDKLIGLASFSVSDEEKQRLEKELDDFLDYAKVINEFPSENLQPASHAVQKDALLREDDESNWEKLELLINNGPVIEGTSYIVPPQKVRSGEEKEIQDTGDLKAVNDHEYEAVIGLEIHAQLKTNSKLFCKCSTKFGNKPNSNTCPVCSGHPGVLPVLNEEAVKMAILAGLSMNCKINKSSVFARKNYFYPDLPKGYQISQFEEPICSGGFVEIEIDEKIKKVLLNRIHMEEDAGKLVHIGAPGIWGAKASAVDFNRTSVPLIEIVSEPDLSSAREAKEYVVMLRAILMSLGICDGNMEEGSLRCDANISIRPKGDKKLGVKTEIKNMNSYKAIERAIDFEITRQKKLIRFGMEVEQQTRLWNESSQKTILMRSKEESHDYRYFPDPDLLPLVLKDEIIESVKNKVQISPLQRKKIYEEKYSFNEDQAKLLMVNPDYAVFFEKTLGNYKNAKNLANWFFNEVLSFMSGIVKKIPFTTEDFAELLNKVDNNEISGKIAKYVLKKSFETNNGLLEIIDSEGLKQITDNSVIKEIVQKVLDKNTSQVSDYKAGKINIFGFFVGQVMKESGGKANPKMVNKMLRDLLDS